MSGFDIHTVGIFRTSELFAITLCTLVIYDLSEESRHILTMFTAVQATWLILIVTHVGTQTGIKPSVRVLDS